MSASTQPRTLETTTDPTGTAQLRERFQRRFRARWRDLRGETRRELTGDAARGGLIRKIRADRGVGTHDFRDWFHRTVYDTVYEPVAPRQIERGEHWTGPYIRDAYNAGLERAASQLETIGVPADEIATATAIHHDAHRAALESQYAAAYHDVQDAAWATITQATRSFRDQFEEDASESKRKLVDAVNDRIEKIGENRTRLLTEQRVVETFNGALVVTFVLVGVTEVGVVPEASGLLREIGAGETTTNAHAHEHEHADDDENDHDHPAWHAREPFVDRVNFDWGGARRALGDDPDLSFVPEYDEERVPEEGGEFERTVLEWTTAGDDRVCDICASQAGTTYNLKEVVDGAAFVPPDPHPGCRCSLIALGRHDLGS